MAEIAEKPSADELTGNTGEPPAPGHDVWFRSQVKKALAKDRAGSLKYFDLDDVAAEFGFDAR